MRTAGSYRDLLNDEFQKRLDKNSRYSLRAFARDTDVSAAFLSQIISGKRRLSEDRAEHIAERLGWNRARSERFAKFVRAELTKRPTTRARLLKEAAGRGEKSYEIKSISMDHFRVISDWFHFPILELTRIAKFELTAESAAARLRISEPQAAIAIQRLKTLSLLVPDAVGSLKKSLANYSTGNIPSAAIRNFHRQMLKKALLAIEGQDPRERDFSGVTMAIDPTMLPVAKKMIQDFRRELMATLETSDNPSALYHFSAQLFRLDQQEKP